MNITNITNIAGIGVAKYQVWYQVLSQRILIVDTSHQRRLYSPRWMSSSFHVNLQTLSSTVIRPGGALAAWHGSVF